MTDPRRTSDPGSDPEPEGKNRPSGASDPWGVRRAEKLLTSLSGVLSARVVVSPIGEVTEVHVLVQSGIPPKQVVRNVESALLAQLGLRIDHRKISVAQTADIEPIDVLEQRAVAIEAKKRGVLYEKLDIQPRPRHRIRAAVALKVAGETIVGEQDAADSTNARIQGSARAAVSALDKVLPIGTLELEGVIIMTAFGLDYAFAGVRVVGPRGQQLLTGTCEVKNTAEEAAVLAVLDATNRWLQSQK